MKLIDVLVLAIRAGASDVHLTVASRPVLRVNGTLVKLEGVPVLTTSDTEEFFYSIADTKVRERFERSGEVDFSCSVAEVGRFRCNAFRQRGAIALSIRIVPHSIPSLEELGVPAIVGEMVCQKSGLFLVTGPTGSGKSSTLAAIVDRINSEQRCHIITLEDPIEYLHRHKQAIVNQRELGVDTRSFAAALRAALRQDPDVILVGEMRDLETISVALTAAETGHLILATLHTADVSQAVERIVDEFPPYQREQVKVQLASVLVGVVSQQLVPRADGSGRVAAFEVLVATPVVKNLIREGKTHQILSAIQTGVRYGMRTMDSSLYDLLQKGLISEEEFRTRAKAPSNFG
ncbi:MAG: type IV pilus twitching motility protein PilT [Bacillota bacterium]